MSKVEPMVNYKVSEKELDEYCGGKKTYTPKDGTWFHTETDCYQEWYVHHSFLGIKWTEKDTITRACSHMPSGGNRCPECCENCTFIPKSNL